MSTTRPKWMPLVALAIFLPILTACGGSGEPSGGSGTAGGATASSDQYVKFAQCMRENGVPEWPDPIDGTKFLMPMNNGKPVINPDSPNFKAATQKCRPLAPPGWDGSEQTPVDQAQMLKYAQCMRQNGVPEFPDDGALDTANLNPESPQFKAAAQKCQSLRPAGVGG